MILYLYIYPYPQMYLYLYLTGLVIVKNYKGYKGQLVSYNTQGGESENRTRVEKKNNARVLLLQKQTGCPRKLSYKVRKAGRKYDR